MSAQKINRLHMKVSVTLSKHIRISNAHLSNMQSLVLL